jgi:hypothetical protein
VTSIARNIHIIGRRERSPRPAGTLSPGETGAIRTREASQGFNGSHLPRERGGERFAGAASAGSPIA